MKFDSRLWGGFLPASCPKESNGLTNVVAEMLEVGTKSITQGLSPDLFLSDVLLLWQENGAKYLGYLDVVGTR